MYYGVDGADAVGTTSIVKASCSSSGAAFGYSSNVFLGLGEANHSTNAAPVLFLFF